MIRSGMTLSEIIITIGVIAFAVPLILAATGNAYQIRQAAEVDTRSAWLARDVQRRIINGWTASASNSGDEETFPFPTSSPSTMEISFSQNGTWLRESTDRAAYLALIKAEPFTSNSVQSQLTPLARITITIQYPAKASPNHRKQLSYQFLSSRNGMP